jgi:hypothetical protein
MAFDAFVGADGDERKVKIRMIIGGDGAGRVPKFGAAPDDADGEGGDFHEGIF